MLTEIYCYRTLRLQMRIVCLALRERVPSFINIKREGYCLREDWGPAVDWCQKREM